MSLATSNAVLALALWFAVGCAAEQSCESRRTFLVRTKFADGCQKACENYTGTNRECAAWEFTSTTEKCHGYILDRTDRVLARYTHCKRISGAFLESFPATDSLAEASLPADDEGCSISEVELGLTKTKELCESACVSLDSNIYGGCAAWLWNEESNECSGLLSKKSSVWQCGSS